MAIINFFGFETGDLGECQASSGTVSVVTSPVRSGSYALRVNPTTTGTGYVATGGIQADGTPNSSVASNNVFVRFYFRFATAPAANDEEIFQLGNVAAAVYLYVRLNSAGNLVLYNNTTLLATGSTVLSANTWYRIEVRKQNGAAGVWELKIDGTVEISTTQNATHTAQTCRFGKTTDRNGQSVDFFYDDVAIDNNVDYPGEGACLRLAPDGDGNYTANWTASAGALWQCVDEVPHDTDTTYITSSTSGSAFTAALVSTATAGISGTIIAAKAYHVRRRVGTAHSNILRLRSGSTDSDTTAAAQGTTYAYFFKMAATDPATSAAWTTSGLDGAEVGILSAASTQERRMTACGLMVDFGPAVTNQTGTPGTATVTASAIQPSATATSFAPVTPGTVTFTASSVSNSASAQGAAPVTPLVSSVAVSATSPTATAQGTVTLAPSASTVTITSADAIATGTGTAAATPDAAAVAVSGIAPVATATGTVTLSPAAASIAVSAIDATATGSGTGTAAPAFATITISATDAAATAAGIATATPAFATIIVGAAAGDAIVSLQTATPGLAVVALTSHDAVAAGTSTASRVPGVAAVVIEAADIIIEPAPEVASHAGSGYSAFHRRALIAQIMREEEEIVALVG